MKNDFDVIVVGAGPAGCAAAYDLAHAGFEVLLLDRSTFPRPKACAGGVTIKALEALRYSIDPVVRTWIFDFGAGLRLEQLHRLRGRDVVCAMTVRSELDLFCLSKTIAAGARFEVARVSSLEEQSDSVLITTSAGRRRAKFVIGADGANGRVSRVITSARGVSNGLAIEATVSNQIDVMRFDFGVADGGYGWAFPKGDHTNVGVYSSFAGAKLLRQDLANYANGLWGDHELRNFRGQQVPIIRAPSAVATKRVLLAGDAAGLVDPLLGEGIYNAVRSGQLAAATLSSAIARNAHRADLEYTRKLRPILEDLRACRDAADRFYGHLDFGVRVLRSPIAGSVFMRGTAAGKTFGYIRKRFFLLALAEIPGLRRNPPEKPAWERNPSYLGSAQILETCSAGSSD